MAMPRSLLDLTIQHFLANYNQHNNEKWKLKKRFETICGMTFEQFRAELPLWYQIRTDSCMDLLLAASNLSKRRIVTVLKVNGMKKYVMCSQVTTSSILSYREFLQGLPPNTLTQLEIRDLNDSALNVMLRHRDAIAIKMLEQLSELTIDKFAIAMSGFLKIVRKCKNLKKISANKIMVDVRPKSKLIGKKFVKQTIHLFESKQMSWSLNTKVPKDWFQERRIRLYLSPRSIECLNLISNLRNFTTDFQLDCSTFEDEDALQEFFHLPKVRFADFNCANGSANALRLFLERNGQNLKELRIECLRRGVLTTEQLLSWCPNLEQFTMLDCYFTESILQREHLRRLNFVSSLYELDGEGDDVPHEGFMFFEALEQHIEFELIEELCYRIYNGYMKGYAAERKSYAEE